MIRVAPLASPRGLCLAIVCWLAAACSADPRSQTPDIAAAATDPPGAALPLSIGGQVESEGDSANDAAINCAAALDQTAQRLASMTADARSSEIAIIRQAEDFFAAEAETQAEAQGMPGSVDAAIARRKREKADEATAQAQLAIACLRRYGERIEEQPGAAS
jgi:S-formylglutathione hydrolase FrmB